MEVVMPYLQKYLFQKKTYSNAFNLITHKNEAKTVEKHTS